MDSDSSSCSSSTFLWMDSLTGKALGCYPREVKLFSVRTGVHPFWHNGRVVSGGKLQPSIQKFNSSLCLEGEVDPSMERGPVLKTGSLERGVQDRNLSSPPILFLKESKLTWM